MPKFLPIISTSRNVCFIEGAIIKLDQGFLEIENVDPDIHTINGKKIIAVTKSVSTDDFLICFEKGSLGNNIPSKKTTMTHNHEVFHNKKMRKAIDCMNFSRNINKVKYSGEILYNILMEEHQNIEVNNMICETLNPKNPIAELYTILRYSSPEKQKTLAREYNEYIIKNNKFNKNQINNFHSLMI